jgi:NaMN:DMB phosphoribosyltransferase
MGCVLLIVNKILRVLGKSIATSNLSLCTTKWVAQDKNSNIKALLEELSFDINAYYVDFDFSKSEHPALKLYDQGEAKEGVGAGGALMYGFLNGLTIEQISKQVESFLA